MPVSLTRVVLDVLKPRELGLSELVKAVCEEVGAGQVSADIVEVDVKTETVKMTVEGEDLDLDLLLEKLEELGCAVRSIDSITATRISAKRPAEED
uniref:DUF211 domain-containing protein n=1 Tax=Thermofilum pendens TaxID=2269 RepID=A0A7C3WLU9_THEPE